jgi:hypothetical protein
LGAGEMNQLVVELSQFWDPSTLAIIEFLGFPEVEKIKMVGIDQGLVWRSVEVVPPFA